MTVRETVLDPTGLSEGSTDATLAARPAGLTGLTVGLLDNTKPNATALLEAIADELKRVGNVADARIYTKDYFGTPVHEELLNKIVQECDVVVTAVGDCGSCSAATVADGILFERAGLPAASICTDSFMMSGRAMATVQGFPGYRFVTAPHPVASLDAGQILERARDITPGVLHILGVEA